MQLRTNAVITLLSSGFHDIHVACINDISFAIVQPISCCANTIIRKQYLCRAVPFRHTHRKH